MATDDIPAELRDKASKIGLECMFNINVEEGKVVSISFVEYVKTHLMYNAYYICYVCTGVSVVGRF